VPEIYVIAETASLGENIHALLLADDWDSRLVAGLAEAESQERASPSSAPPLLIGACNRGFCETLDRWRSSPLASSKLIIVGGRDPAGGESGGPCVVSLPLDPGALLTLVRRLRES
jgi:hypothetical protein